MAIVAIRDPEQARKYVLQGLCLQTVRADEPDTVQRALNWAIEILSHAMTLPPLGLVADVGHVSLGFEPTARPKRDLDFGGLLSRYEDHVLGKLYADNFFVQACDHIRNYRAGRDQARGLAFLLERFSRNLDLDGVAIVSRVLQTMLSESPERLLEEGKLSLLRDGLLPPLAAQYESIIVRARRTSEPVRLQDVLALQSGAALEGEADRVALEQLAEAMAMLEENLPRRSARAAARREEVPTSLRDEDVYPVGGFASLATRGSVESLLQSQLAFIEEHENIDLFTIKYLRDELLYYSRDENQFRRQRRTFLIYLAPDLVDVIRFKDVELPFQRGILLLAFLVVAVRRLVSWLSSDALTFAFVFPCAEGTAEPFPLDQEFTWLARLLLPELVDGVVTFHLLQPTGAPERELAEMRQRWQDRLPRLTVQVHRGPHAFTELCHQYARRSLCQLLLLSCLSRNFESREVRATEMQLSGGIPSLGDQAEVGMARWSSALQDLLTGWV